MYFSAEIVTVWDKKYCVGSKIFTVVTTICISQYMLMYFLPFDFVSSLYMSDVRSCNFWLSGLLQVQKHMRVLYVSCRVPPPPMALSCSLAHLLWANASGDGVVCCHWEQVRAKIHAYTLALMKPYGFFWGASFFFLVVPLKKKKKLICRVIFQLTLCGFSDVEPLGSTSLKFLESMNREQCDSHKWVNKAGVI